METKGSYYRRRMIGGLIIYGILALGVLPIFTLYMGTQGNIFQISMSEMGNANVFRHLLFIIWTILFCSVFSSFIGYLLLLTKNTKSKIRFLVTFAVVVLIIGNIIPFLPELFPIFAGMHNLFAQISSVTLAIVLMLFSLTLRNTYTVLFKKSLVFVLIIWGVILTLTIFFQAASITTMFGTMIANIFLFVVLLWLYREDTFDPVQSLKEIDAIEAQEEADKLWKRAQHAKQEYLKLEAAARKASHEADEAAYIAKIKKNG